MTTPWPVELRATGGGQTLVVAFDTGERFEIAASKLRQRSPSAEGRGHGANAPQRPDAYAHVRIVSMTPIGRYAARIAFDDGHDTGLFTWALLLALGQETAQA